MLSAIDWTPASRWSRSLIGVISYDLSPKTPGRRRRERDPTFNGDSPRPSSSDMEESSSSIRIFILTENTNDTDCERRENLRSKSGSSPKDLPDRSPGQIRHDNCQR